MLKSIRMLFRDAQRDNVLILDDIQQAWSHEDRPKIILSKKFMPFFRHDKHFKDSKPRHVTSMKFGDSYFCAGIDLATIPFAEYGIVGEYCQLPLIELAIHKIYE